MGKPRDTKIAILPSTTRKGTTLSTSAALDSPSVIDKLVSPPHASRAGTSAESENSHNIDNVSAVLDDSGSLGSFLDATIAKSRQIENTETPNAATPVNSPESVEYSSDDLDEDYVELNDDFIEKCNATTDARKIKKLLAEHAVRYKLSPDPKFATSPISIRDKDYDFSLDLSHIAIVEKTPFCGTEKESAVEHMTELSTLSGLFSDDIKMRTYFVAKIFPFSLKDDAKTWYNNLSPGSIKSPKELLDVFFRKYFPASAQHAALQRIYNFDQEDGEKLPEAWARFCSLIRAQPDHDLEKNDLLDIFYSGLTIESRAYLDSCAGCVFRKRTPDDAEELLAKIGRNHDDWSTPEPTPTPIVKKRGMIKLNDEDMREAKKSLKEKGIKPEDVKNLPPIEDICETIPPSSMIEDFKFNWSRSDPMVQYKIYNKAVNLPFGVFCAAIGVPQWGSCEKIRGTPRELSDLYTRICNGRSLSNDDALFIPFLCSSGRHQKTLSFCSNVFLFLLRFQLLPPIGAEEQGRRRSLLRGESHLLRQGEERERVERTEASPSTKFPPKKRSRMWADSEDDDDDEEEEDEEEEDDSSSAGYPPTKRLRTWADSEDDDDDEEEEEAPADSWDSDGEELPGSSADDDGDDEDGDD
ncbi:hypothetical protein QYE76_018144 [Lolium multiflorum]|uniref:Retrotransposon gag domain-containing protein n=1 Tax=Lolium multiflorum TaxID=4521 RepID=A0AAD8QIH7_LOLMU|nr:hypothetical protein QYE76_018144 [Lolium multiflorum]